MAEARIVIIGAGPAGIRAAEALARHGVRPILVDEAPRGGGQIYRQPPDGFRRSAKARYGFDAKKATALHRTLRRIAGAIDYRPATLAWNIWDRQVYTFREGVSARIPFDSLVIATGAMDRVLPLPNWTLPGVYSLGGAQVALKYQGCVIGRRTVFTGTGPLLYLVAYQYAKAGAKVAAVLDTGVAAAKRRALPRLLSARGTLAKGLYYYAWLRGHGLPIEEGVSHLAFEGVEWLRGVTYRRGGSARTIACDAAGIGFGLKSETQLADLAGCEFRFDEPGRQWLPERNAEGESTVSGVFLAGDGAGIGGADAAELWGERIGLTLAGRCGRLLDPNRLAAIDRGLARLRRFAAGLAEAFPIPTSFVARLGDETILCRCEAIRIGEARAAIRVWDVVEMNRLKAVTRIGMGRCQGRLCGLAAAELLSAMTGRDLASIGRLRGQPPVKPLPMPWPGLSGAALS